MFRNKYITFMSGIWFPVIMLSLVLFASIFGDSIAKYSPTEGSLRTTLIPPAFVAGGSMEHLLGTDNLGRDVFSRLLAGTRTTVLVGVFVVLVAGTIGTVIGVLAGYCGRAVDTALMRLTDAVLSIPYMLIALSLSVVLGPGAETVVFVLGITSWANYAKVVRVETMRLKNQDFVTLAKLSGAGTVRVLARHILPNLVNTIIVMATLQLGMAIILSASLSFLGLGAAPPSSEWGLMMSEGRDYIATAWWLTTVPGIAIFLTVLSVNALGNTLRIKMDPKRMVSR
ncbi:ABC transporter permease [Brevibacillus sp. NRS-1366]|uniref:ABC transporter permease n=1 Tax=Brevibacillus sp. NRS-1366 TaxID=3233899 RepID=UPI003D1F7A71